MHFWIDKRSQANINQCRANARLTLNRLQPLEYVRPPHQQHHHHHHPQNYHHGNNSNSTSSNSNSHSYNYPNLNSTISNNSYCRTSNSNFINRTNRNTNIGYNNNNNNNNNSCSNSSSSGNNITNTNLINSNMINTAATGSAHSTYRIPQHQNIDIDSTFGPNDQNHQEPIVRPQPHLRWQVLVIFTFFVVTIRFYVLGNRSEVLIYCISGLILVMALLIFSALNLQKKLTNGNNTNYNTTSPRFDGVQHTRLINTTTNNRLGTNSSSGGGGGVGVGVGGGANVIPNTTNSNNNHHQSQHATTGNRCPYVQQLVLQQNNGSLNRNGINRDAQILAEAVVLLPPSPTQILQENNNSEMMVGRHHSENSIAPPPYDMAILLPGKNKNKKLIGIEIESSEDETPPPSYAAVTDINN